MIPREAKLFDHLIRLIRAAVDADYVELAVGDDTVTQGAIGDAPTTEPLTREEHRSWFPRFGPANQLTQHDELVGSVVVYPVTGPSAEQGTLLAFSRTPDHFDDETLQELESAVVLVERHLDQVVEQIRLDQITEVLRRNQDDLQATQAKLELSNNELEQFAYIAAHELVAPLRSVAVYAEVLDMNSEELSDAQLQSCTREIRDGVALMDRQVRNLLELSSTQQQAADPVPVDLTPVVEDAVESLRTDIAQAGATVRIRTSLPTVRGGWVLIQSVFVNLISNALKFRDQSRQLEIVIDSETIDHVHRVNVTDNGPGINPEDHDRIFRLFERASTSAAGSGIGLGLSRRILEAFGGHLTYEESESGGSRFILSFPTIECQDQGCHDCDESTSAS